MREFKIDKINKTVILEFTYDEEIVAQIKTCSYNSRWNAELRHWIIPVDGYSKQRIVSLISQYNFIQAGVKPVEMKKFDYSLSEEDLALTKAVVELAEFTYTARDYQLEALGYAIQRGNIINGDDVGLGKTFESIMYAEIKQTFPCLVIVPASVKEQWAEKWLEITGNKREVSVIESKETKKHKNNWNAEVVVINYDIIGKKQGTGATVKFDELLDIDWRMVIFDEAHFLKEKKSQRAGAAKRITQKSEAIIQMLSGTVTMNKPVELWNLLVLAKVDKYIAKDWMQFVMRYCGGYRGKFGFVTSGATNTLELNQKLREICYLRREKREVLTELPDVTPIILRTPITNQKEIDEATSNFIEYIRDTKGEEAADRAMEAEALVALGVLRRLAIAGKMKAIEQYLNDWKQGDTKLVIFGLHKEGLEYLSKKYKSPLIAGGVNSKKKREIVKSWIENDEQFLFANMQSAGTGVDGLQLVCSNMLITELPWRPSDLEQAIGRLDRSEQTEATTVTYMLSFNTIDGEMWEMLEEKELVTEAVNKGVDVEKSQSGMKTVMRKILKKQKKSK